MKVPATLDFPGPVLVADADTTVPDTWAGGVPTIVIRKAEPDAQQGDLFVAGVKVAEQAWVLRTDAERVYEAGKQEPVELVIRQTSVACVVDYGTAEDVPF